MGPAQKLSPKFFFQNGQLPKENTAYKKRKDTHRFFFFSFSKRCLLKTALIVWFWCVHLSPLSCFMRLHLIFNFIGFSLFYLVFHHTFLNRFMLRLVFQQKQKGKLCKGLRILLFPVVPTVFAFKLPLNSRDQCRLLNKYVCSISVHTVEKTIYDLEGCVATAVGFKVGKAFDIKFCSMFNQSLLNRMNVMNVGRN